MALADIRHPGKGRLVHKFTAAAGSVRSIDFRNNYIVACGLDRHLYLYNVYEKKAIKKVTILSHYLTSTVFSSCIVTLNITFAFVVVPKDQTY